jgi:hypothetical protein
MSEGSMFERNLARKGTRHVWRSVHVAARSAATTK